MGEDLKGDAARPRRTMKLRLTRAATPARIPFASGGVQSRFDMQQAVRPQREYPRSLIVRPSESFQER